MKWISGPGNPSSRIVKFIIKESKCSGDIFYQSSLNQSLKNLYQLPDEQGMLDDLTMGIISHDNFFQSKTR